MTQTVSNKEVEDIFLSNGVLIHPAELYRTADAVRAVVEFSKRYPAAINCQACGAGVGERCRTLSGDQCDAGKYEVPA